MFYFLFVIAHTFLFCLFCVLGVLLCIHVSQWRQAFISPFEYKLVTRLEKESCLVHSTDIAKIETNVMVMGRFEAGSRWKSGTEGPF